MTKIVFITGGVVSSLGKGICTSSIAALLQSHGYRVRIKKLDPYLNIDPGTMSPLQHGEVFVTDDGTETDLDIGHYERFTDISASKFNSITSGKIYSKLLLKERNGDYLGRTVQVIPHVTELIKEFITKDIESVDFLLCEIGGTIGDIEGLPYLEAIRQLGYERGMYNSVYIHLTFVPYLKYVNELKTKPTQHSVKELRGIGIQPDIIICRSEKRIPDSERKKISLLCNLKEHNIISSCDLDCIYKVPIAYYHEGVDRQILSITNMQYSDSLELSKWYTIYHSSKLRKYDINIAIIAKYYSYRDAYKSLIEAFKHVEFYSKFNIKLIWIETNIITESNIDYQLRGIDGVVIPGGFGERGIEAKILAVQYSRIHKIPFFGICLGMQLSVIEYARNVLNITDANSSEFSNNCTPLFDVKTGDTSIGGTLRLGSYTCVLKKSTSINKIYKSEKIKERHRHRYEFNTRFIDIFANTTLSFTAWSLDSRYVEAVEIKDHPWFIGVQYHPEYKSRPFSPHPLFVSFIESIEGK